MSQIYARVCCANWVFFSQIKWIVECNVRFTVSNIRHMQSTWVPTAVSSSSNVMLVSPTFPGSMPLISISCCPPETFVKQRELQCPLNLASGSDTGDAHQCDSWCQPLHQTTSFLFLDLWRDWLSELAALTAVVTCCHSNVSWLVIAELRPQGKLIFSALPLSHTDNGMTSTLSCISKFI